MEPHHLIGTPGRRATSRRPKAARCRQRHHKRSEERRSGTDRPRHEVPGLPDQKVELDSVQQQIATIKTVILKGIDAGMFVAELKQLQARAKALIAVQAETEPNADGATLLHGDLAVTYREKVARLTDAPEDQALQAQAFERIRALIEAVVLTPEAGELAIHLRGELASMLERCACPHMQNAPEEVSSRALQIKMVAGTRFHLNLRSRPSAIGGHFDYAMPFPALFPGLFATLA